MAQQLGRRQCHMFNVYKTVLNNNIVCGMMASSDIAYNPLYPHLLPVLQQLLSLQRTTFCFIIFRPRKLLRWKLDRKVLPLKCCPTITFGDREERIGRFVFRCVTTSPSWVYRFFLCSIAAISKMQANLAAALKRIQFEWETALDQPRLPRVSSSVSGGITQ